jgi:hypothetical protein
MQVLKNFIKFWAIPAASIAACASVALIVGCPRTMVGTGLTAVSGALWTASAVPIPRWRHLSPGLNFLAALSAAFSGGLLL